MLVPLAEIVPDRLIGGRRIARALAQVDAAGIEKAVPPEGMTIADHQAAPSLHSFAECLEVPMSDTEDLAFAAEFPAATREQWLKLVDGVLKGAPFDKRLVARSL